MTGRNKKAVFSEVQDKVWKKLSGWKERFLSTAGKEVLIKSVVQAIPSYIMQCFKMPNSICNSITSLTRSFWWGQQRNERRIAWRAWDKLCEPKKFGGLGFRNIRSFNQALLAKQCWRLLSFPQSLPAQILAAKYFPADTFLTAQLGHRPSFVWRSLLYGRDLLRVGLRWNIGDGRSTSIWDDHWVPLTSPQLLIPTKRILNPDGRVYDLIDRNIGCWNVASLQEHFMPWEVDRIQQIPLTRLNQPDRPLWHYSSNGDFTVKTAYHVAMERENCQRATSSTGSSTIWNTIWHLNIQPKVRIFLWKIISGILPSKSNLLKRRISDGICDICRTNIETERHCLFECSWAKNVWLQHDLGRRWFHIAASSFQDLFEAITFLESTDHVHLFCNVVWLIWKDRNSRLYGGTNGVGRIWERAQHMVDECPLKEKVSSANNLAGPHAWSKPASHFIKINVDAAWKQLTAGFGVVGRNSEGAITFAYSEPRKHVSSALHAEAMAMIQGLRLALDMNLRHVILETDSSLLCQQITGESVNLTEMGNLLVEIRRLSALFESASFSVVKRDANHVAHLLAKLGFDSLTSHHWGAFPPSHVTLAAIADLNE